MSTDVLANIFGNFHKTRGTSPEHLEEMRERLWERMNIRRNEIKDLHEMIANDTCVEHGLTTDEAMRVVKTLDEWCAMDEDRIEAINDLLRR